MYVYLYRSCEKATVEDLIREGLGLHIRCACGHEAKWSCEETFGKLRGDLPSPMAEVAKRFKCQCGDPRLKVDAWRDLLDWGGVKPETTYLARVAKWSGE